MKKNKSFDENNILEFLDFISSLKKSYEQESKNKSKLFNIFSILKIERLEAKTHTPFITELLNPKGSHNLGSVFLEEFINLFKVPDFDVQSSTVELIVEKIDRERIKGGYIDIFLNSVKGSFFIENKIYAADLENQLLRYHNSYPGAKIFYLTLNGAEPSKSSTDGEKFDVHCLSYREDIIEWLEKCLPYSDKEPAVREAICQYINIIKILTGRTINVEESMKITEKIIENDNYLKAFIDLQSNSIDIYQSLFKMIKEEVRAAASDLSADIDFILGGQKTESIDFSKQYSGFSFRFKSIPKVSIVFQFQEADLKGCLYGLCDYKCSEEERKRIRTIFEEESFDVEGSSKAWIVYFKFEGYSDWGSEQYLNLKNGKFNEDLKTTVRNLLNVLKKCKLV